MSCIRVLTVLVALTGWLMVPGIARAQSGRESTPVDFREQIQPILAGQCFACHGPDEHERQAGLRLDIEEGAREGAIVAGRSADSELIRRIFSDDPDEVMPPPDSNRQLTAEQRELLKRWVDEGAVWQRHWAFEPIRAVQPPSTESTWARNEIDRFIEARLSENGLKHSPQAERRTLIRRLYFDLTGIGPTPAQVQAFVDDTSNNAVEKVIDELLASPHYGEQMAVAWLDSARFADTNGFQNDFVRSMWPWRDWVIEAFNQNIAYDDFIVQQIAGDMLPNPSRSHLIATGFNRNNRSNTEGGSIDEEWRIENCVDRVEVTSATFLGLTTGCARCHDHKYDPFSQKEFYQFFAFFNNIDEQGVYTETRGNVGPMLKVPTAEQIAGMAEADRKIAALKEQAEPKPGQADAVLEAWKTEFARKAIPLPEPVYRLAQAKTDYPTGSGPIGNSIVFSGSDGLIPAVDPVPLKFERDLPFSWSAWVHGDARGAVFGRMDEQAAYRGVDTIILPDGRLKVHLIHEWKVNAIAVTSKTRLPPGDWTYLTVTWDGSSKAAGCKIYFDGHPAEVEVEIDTLTESVAAEVPFRVGQRNKSEFFQGELSRFQLFDCELAAEQVLASLRQAVVDRAGELSSGNLSSGDQETFDKYVALLALNAARQELTALQATRDKLEAEQQTTMIMRERPEYRATHLLRRGQYDLPDTTVELWPAIPSMLPQLAGDQPPNRLGLARWMVDDRNPLVARVAVNRAWMKFFGRGLVETPDNFGLQGSPPTHPLLLDWLADDFRCHGWDLKRLHKQIAMSATYQQSSLLTADLLKTDPGNRWYSRGPRYRLSAEQIRDNALALSGLLVEKIGGPSVRPWQPEGLWEELAGGANNGPYVRDSGESLYRRSLYTYRKRTVSHPTVSTFDSPSWEICQIQRGRTNTPLQSLALLNDITYVEAARKMAGRMMGEGGATAEDQVRYGFLLATSREPDPRELKTLLDGYEEYKQFYSNAPEAAGELLAAGEAPGGEAWPADQLAAMASVASVLLNLDEVITKE
jgi:mono/diheme cytochrome c family protein